MPYGSERNTTLVSLFLQLDRGSARVLERRLANPDHEDEFAHGFQRVVDTRNDLLGILAGTRMVRIDPSQVRLPPRASSGAARVHALPVAEPTQVAPLLARTRAVRPQVELPFDPERLGLSLPAICLPSRRCGIALRVTRA